MKRKVKYFKRVRNGRTYYYPWVGYSFRNHNGNPDFKREINLSALPEAEVAAIDTVLRCGGQAAGSMEEVEFLDSVSFGAEWTALRIAEQLGIVDQLERLDEKHREAILCMVLDRVVNPKPYSKSALFESLPGSGLERVVAPGGTELKLHDLYIALERLHEAQSAIQRGLFKAKPRPQRMYLYDITSSYLEGCCCPLADFGYNRDGKKGKMQIVIGLLTDAEGLPVAVEVFEGNTSDQTTVMGQIDKLRCEFGIDEMVFIGDRGMLTRPRRADLQDEDYERIKYITALTRDEMFGFLDNQDHPLQMGLFDRHNLVEIEHDGVRYVLCFNPEKEQEDRTRRLELIAKTEEKLEMIRRNVEAGNWRREKVIAARLHRWLNRWGMARFFTVDYGEGRFEYRRDHDTVRAYEAVDGCYVIVSDTSADELSTEQVRDRYKSLALVEQAFRSMKSTDLQLRPLRHWTPERVKGHVFMCMLAYMIVWRARRLFRPLLAADAAEAERQTTTTADDRQSVQGTSLRRVWDRLREIKIGTIRIGTRTHQQLKPLTNDLKSMLNSAGASITGEAVARLGL